ncbi:hypothetical protein FQR65_LT07983 [Abscondita terminalis]|nr:hypothetical protein FQR65_LT07983 [Abscondita terminalis]
MKAIVIAIYLVSIQHCVTQELNSRRRYFPEENDPLRIKTLSYINSNNELYVEDLLVGDKSAVHYSSKDVTIYLYTANSPKTGFAFTANNFEDLINSEIYDKTKINYFIIHGWQNDFSNKVNELIKESVLKVYDVNVFVVDWSAKATQNYFSSQAAVPKIGRILGNFIKSLIDYYNLPVEMFKLVGHSLGAHVAGCAGAVLNGTLDYIVGLDPAGPLFSLGNTEERLDKSDAKFVHVVHTSFFLGFRSAIGHADYYPNNGFFQPGCGFDIFGTCAHSRAYHYFAESILEGRFSSKQCKSYTHFKNENCNHQETSYIGTFHIDKRADGDYYLDTNNQQPYALG